MFENYLNDTVTNANIALKHRLYVSGWQLSGTLVHIRNNVSPDTLVLLNYDNNGIPNGVVCAEYRPHYNLLNVQVFVRKSERNKGIGRKLVSRVKEMSPNVNFNWDCGIKGSREFWIKQFKETNKC